MREVSDASSGGYDDAEETLSQALSQDDITAPAESRRQQFWRHLLVSRNAAITIVGIILFIFFSVSSERFLTTFSLLNMVRNTALVGMVAVGMTYLMIAGEIDLSVGSVFGFLTVVLGVLVSRNSWNVWLATLVVVTLGALIGMVNGLIRTKIGIPSFIVTLAGFSIYRSAALIVSNQQPSTANVDSAPFFYKIMGGNIVGDVPWHIIWMLIVTLIGGIILATTKFGYHIYATGGNLEAARNSGVNSDRVKVICFIMVSALCGMIAPLLFAWLRVAAPITGTGFEFRVIGAVIVGGVALTGGRGTIYGVLMGTVIIGMITSGLVLLGFSQHWGDVATGLLIALVGGLDLLARRAGSRSMGILGR